MIGDTLVSVAKCLIAGVLLAWIILCLKIIGVEPSDNPEPITMWVSLFFIAIVVVPSISYYFIGKKDGKIS